MTQVDAIVVGGGLGGLAASIVLGAQGRRTLLLEAAECLGGKAGTTTIDGVTVDTGPSVLTMPHTLLGLLRTAGLAPDDHIQLRAASPGFRYHFADDTVLDVHHAVGDTLDSVHATLGGQAARELEAFLAYSRRIWESAAPYFVEGPAPTLPNLLRLGPSDLLKVRHIDALRSMRTGIHSLVHHPHLRTLLARYATYNGSDPRVAPATLNCIAHVELALGGYGVEGGIGHMVDVLAEAARRVGVVVRTGSRVDRILTPKGRVGGVRTSDGCVFQAPLVVSNAEAAHTATDLLDGTLRSGIDTVSPRSMSGWTGILRACRPGADSPRAPHTVWFPDDYDAEFADIFDRDRPPAAPTVYLCAQEACHGRTGWPTDEPVFAMVNTPPEPLHGPRAPEVWTDLSTRLHRHLVDRGAIQATDSFVWTRTPTQLEDSIKESNRERPASVGPADPAQGATRSTGRQRRGRRRARPRRARCPREPDRWTASTGARPGAGGIHPAR